MEAANIECSSGDRKSNDEAVRRGSHLMASKWAPKEQVVTEEKKSCDSSNEQQGLGTSTSTQHRAAILNDTQSDVVPSGAEANAALSQLYRFIRDLPDSIFEHIVDHHIIIPETAHERANLVNCIEATLAQSDNSALGLITRETPMPVVSTSVAINIDEASTEEGVVVRLPVVSTTTENVDQEHIAVERVAITDHSAAPQNPDTEPPMPSTAAPATTTNQELSLTERLVAASMSDQQKADAAAFAHISDPWERFVAQRDHYRSRQASSSSDRGRGGGARGHGRGHRGGRGRRH